MHSVRSVLIFLSFVCLCGLSFSQPAAAQDSQDNRPHITPRKGPPTPTPKPKSTPQPTQEEQAQPEQPAPASQPQGESSSRDSQADFNAAPRASEPPPATNKEEGTFLPYDPHRADNDVEAGRSYLPLTNSPPPLQPFNSTFLS